MKAVLGSSRIVAISGAVISHFPVTSKAQEGSVSISEGVGAGVRVGSRSSIFLAFIIPPMGIV